MASNELTEELIANLPAEDLLAAWRIASQFGVNVDQLEDVDQIKLALTKELLERQGRIRYPNEATEFLRTTYFNEKAKRHALETWYQRAYVLFQSFDDELVKNLQGSFGDFKNILDEKLEALSNNTTPILVAGETSAGKSSILNLLLNKDILPTSILCCTSVICEIKYGDQRKLVAHRQNKGSIEVELNGSDEEVKQILIQYLQRTEEETLLYNRIELYWDLPFLKDGICIVDSPGIGETEELDERTMTYIKEAFAFIYVIKSDNAGGVQEGRLQAMLTNTKKAQQGEGEEKELTGNFFDPSAAIFVCNFWDRIPTYEQESVKIGTRQKLAKVWEGFDERQLFYLSTNNALEAAKQGYVLPAHETLLKGIHQLIPKSNKKKLCIAKKWLAHVLNKAIFYCSSYLIDKEHEKTGRSIKLANVEESLKILQGDTEKRFADIGKFVKECIGETIGKYRRFLVDLETIKKVILWSDADIVKGTDWETVKSEMDEAIRDRLIDEIERWEKETDILPATIDTIMKEVQRQFNIVEDSMLKIEGQITRNVHVAINVLQEIAEDKTSWRSSLKTLMKLPLAHKIVIGLASPVILPIASAVSLLSIPVNAAIYRRQSSMKLKDYYSNPSEYMGALTVQRIQEFANHDNLEQYVKARLKDLLPYVERLENLVPRFIQADRKALRNIRNDKRSAESNIAVYRETQRDSQALLQELDEFETTELIIFDTNCESVDGYQDEANMIYNGIECKLFKGKWNRMKHEGLISVDDVVIKRGSVLNLEHSRKFLSDCDRLRNVEHKHIAKVLATFSTKQTNFIPYCVMEFTCSTLYSLIENKQFSKITQTSERLAAVRPIMLQLIEALVYLDGQQLICGVLNPHIIRVNHSDSGYEYNIKLYHISREGDSWRSMMEQSDNLDSQQLLRHYLAPETMSGDHLVTRKSDIFSLGHIMWELLCGYNTVTDEGYSYEEVPLEQIVLFRFQTLSYDFPVSLTGLVGKSWQSNPDERPGLRDWQLPMISLDLDQSKTKDFLK